jgi:hypothetical protein
VKNNAYFIAIAVVVSVVLACVYNPILLGIPVIFVMNGLVSHLIVWALLILGVVKIVEMIKR